MKIIKSSFWMKTKLVSISGFLRKVRDKDGNCARSASRLVKCTRILYIRQNQFLFSCFFTWCKSRLFFFRAFFDLRGNFCEKKTLHCHYDICTLIISSFSGYFWRLWPYLEFWTLLLIIVPKLYHDVTVLPQIWALQKSVTSQKL